MTETPAFIRMVQHESHTAPVADCEWCPFPAAREQATPNPSPLITAFRQAVEDAHDNGRFAVTLSLPVADSVLAALAAREAEVRREVEAWLKSSRDMMTGASPGDRWDLLDMLLDDYRLHMQTGTPLDQHVCDGGCGPDCGGA